MNTLEDLDAIIKKINEQTEKLKKMRRQEDYFTSTITAAAAFAQIYHSTPVRDDQPTSFECEREARQDEWDGEEVRDDEG